MRNHLTLKTESVALTYVGYDVHRQARPHRPLADRFKILIVHDGCRELTLEIDDLAQAGLPANAEVEILTVADPFLAAFYLAEGESLDPFYYADDRTLAYGGLKNITAVLKQLHGASNEAATKLKSRFPSWSIRHVVNCEAPAQAVIDKAIRWQPDLVVLGSTDLSWFERLSLRVLTRRLVAEARCSVRVARAKVRGPASAARILIGYDGSKHAAAAIEAARQREWPSGSQAFIVNCIEPLITDELNWAQDYIEVDRARIKTELTHAKQILEQSGLKVCCLVRIGNAAQALLDEAKRMDVDCIFLGTRELGTFGKLLTGSVSSAVVSPAECSVEIVRSGAKPERIISEKKIAA